MLAGWVVLWEQGGIVAAIHKAAQEVLGQLAGTPSGAPAALDAVEGQRHAHDARHEETDGGEGQPDAQGVGGLIGSLPDGGVGLRLAWALREARAEEVAVDGFKRAPEQVLPQHENALADERLHREGHTKHERDPQGATHPTCRWRASWSGANRCPRSRTRTSGR